MPKLNLDDLERLARDLAHLSRAGVPLPEGLRSSATALHGGKLKALSDDVAGSLQRGKPLSEALKESRIQVSPEFIYLVKSGETSGDLSSMLTFAADQARRVKRHRAALTTALTYPFIVILASFGIMFLLANTFMPQMVDIFRQLGANELPPMTKFFFTIGQFFRGEGGIVTALVLVLAVAILVIEEVRMGLYRAALGLPGLRGLSMLSDTTIMMRTLAAMLARGISPSDALRAARLTVWGGEFRDSLERMAVAADQGQPTAEKLPPSMQPTAAWLYAEAEKRGDLADACEGIARYCEERFDRVSIRSIAVAEPLLIIVLGVIIGTVIISAYLPLFTIPKIMGQG